MKNLKTAVTKDDILILAHFLDDKEKREISLQWNKEHSNEHLVQMDDETFERWQNFQKYIETPKKPQN